METDHRDARARILADLEPVQPLRSPGVRALTFWAWLLVPAFAILAGAGLRDDHNVLGPWFSFGASAFFAATAFSFFYLLARESIPGSAAPLSLWGLALVVAGTLQVATAMALHAEHPYPMPEGDAVRLTFVCSSLVTAFAVPLVIGGWQLCRKARPTRPIVAGSIASAAAFIATEALWRLHCPYTSPGHLMSAHWPAIVALAVVSVLLIRHSPKSD